MYGLLLESICDSLRERHGEQVWQQIRQKAGITHHSFITHKKYSETVIPRLAKAAHEVTGIPVSDIMEGFGVSFVAFVGKYGYDRILRVLGRHLRDFLSGLDNLHEYLRFSYPKLKPPSFYCESESSKGLTLHYRSKRKGFVYYVMGQIKQVGKQFYNTPVEVEVISEEESMDMTHVVLQLHFENTAFKEEHMQITNLNSSMPVRSEIFFELFPFHIVFNRAMLIKSVGSGLVAIMPNLIGQAVDEMFMLTRPLVEFSMENVLSHSNNVFEMCSNDTIMRYPEGNEAFYDDASETFTYNTATDDDLDDQRRKLRLKGQMMNMPEWSCIIFMGSPVLENLDKMFDTGLYINDLSMHDSSRDLVLAGTQQSAELKLALDQEQQKSRKLEESMKKLDLEMKKTDSLLYQMIPKAVADRLRKGEQSVNTCEVYDSVTILFSDVVGFTQICSQITPMAVVSMLNAMYTKFDTLSETYSVYKVETIGDAYMVVSGAPTVSKFHALYICDMAFAMVDAMKDLVEPATGTKMRIRVGAHSGTVVAGVVGLKMPRWCLFGDTVNTASRMESNSEANKIHISETTKNGLEGYPYKTEERGTIEVKGKGTMKTYWLLSKSPSARLPPLMNDDNLNTRVPDIMDEVKGYSPVTFEDVARSSANLASIPNSPINQKSTKNSSNTNQKTKELGTATRPTSIVTPKDKCDNTTQSQTNANMNNMSSTEKAFKTNMGNALNGEKKTNVQSSAVSDRPTATESPRTDQALSSDDKPQVVVKTMNNDIAADKGAKKSKKSRFCTIF